MPHSGCSAFHGVNPNFKKNKNLNIVKYKIHILFIDKVIYIYIYCLYFLNSWSGEQLVKTQIFPTSFNLAAVHKGYSLFSISLFVQVIIIIIIIIIT